MKLAVIESPLAADTEEGRKENKRYAAACMADSLARGEAPYASHLLFDQPGILDDMMPEQREQGIQAGFAWGTRAEVRAVYLDRGYSGGMRRGVAEAERLGQPIDFRSIYGRAAALKLFQEHVAAKPTEPT